MFPVATIAFGPAAAFMLAILTALGFTAEKRRKAHQQPEDAYRELVHKLRHPWAHRLQAPARWFR